MQDSLPHLQLMASSTPEHRQGASGMALVGEYNATVGDGQLGISLVIPVGDTGGPYFWRLFMGSVRRDDEDYGEYPCGVNMPYRGEAGKTAI